jgi:hypothetical protein
LLAELYGNKRIDNIYRNVRAEYKEIGLNSEDLKEALIFRPFSPPEYDQDWYPTFSPTPSTDHQQGPYYHREHHSHYTTPVIDTYANLTLAIDRMIEPGRPTRAYDITDHH